MARRLARREPRLRFAFDQRKAGELAGRLVALAGGSLPMLKLLKLMYVCDRTSLVETGFSITGDSMVSMGKGPVLSESYDRLKPDTESRLPFVSNQGTVRLIAELPNHGSLSDYEIQVARRVWAKLGHMSGEQLIKLLHREAPEWKAPPQGSSKPIDPADILRAAGKSEDEIAALSKQAEYFYVVDRR